MSGGVTGAGENFGVTTEGSPTLLDVLEIDLKSDLSSNPVKVGEGVTAAAGATAVGVNATADTDNTAAFGENAEATGGDATALGKDATAPAQWNTVVGYDAGAADNGDNVVIVGRKATATGDDGTAVGETAAADGDDASAFGWGAKATATAATVVGYEATASAQNATAIGDNATADAQDAVAVGRNTTVSQPDTIGFGPRDLEVDAGNSIVYPSAVDRQVLVDKLQDGTQTSGTAVGYQFAIDGTTIAEIYAESDGAGGLQNQRLDIPVSLTVDGDTTQVDDVVTGDITIEDGGGVEQFRFDATVDPIVADFHDNRVANFGLQAGQTMTYPTGVGAQTLIDKAQDGTQAAGTPVGYSFAVNGASFYTVYAESDGAGGLQNSRVDILQTLNFPNITGTPTFAGHDHSEGGLAAIPNAGLSNSAITVNAGTDLSGGGAVDLGGSTTINLDQELAEQPYAFTRGGLRGAVGAGDGETIRVGGGASDLLHTIQGGNGRFAFTWNARYDTGSSEWDAINGGEPSSHLGIGSTIPGGSNGRNVTVATAAAPGADGDPVTYFGMIFQDDGSLMRQYHTLGQNATSVRYEPNNDVLAWRDEGSNSDKMELERTSGDLSITGALTEGAAL